LAGAARRGERDAAARFAHASANVVDQDLISVGHAKVLLALKAPEEQLAVAETVLRRSATVRATERLVARQLGQAKPRHRRPSSVSVNAKCD